MKTLILSGITALLGVNMALAGPQTKSKSDAQGDLGAGAYSAQVKGIVCGGCGQYIQETLKKFNGIEKISVDQAERTVKFEISEGKMLKLSKIQKALQASAKRMGMGADYQLHNLQKAN